MALIPMEYVGGVVKEATENLTTNTYSNIIFPSDRMVIAATASINGGTYPCIMSLSGSGASLTRLYINATTIDTLPANTTLSIHYLYIQN